MRVYNIGTYPPPLGGISNHIKRLHEYLLAHGRESYVLDPSGVPKQAPGVVPVSTRGLIRFLWRPRSVLHFHIYSFKAFALMYLLSMRHAVVYSLHGEPDLEHISLSRGLRRKLMLAMLKRFAIIADNPTCEEFLTRKLGLANVVTIPEYIPGSEPDTGDLARLRPYRERFDTVLSSNAYQIAFFRDQDLYGLDILVEMMRELAASQNVGMLFLLPGRGMEDYYEQITKRITEYGLVDRFIFIREPLVEASSLWSMSDIVIRATNTDGNALTIHEAMHSGTPVVASDCVDRPDGVILFKTRDVADLVRAVSDTIENLSQRRERIAAMKIENNAEKIDNLYCKLMGVAS